MTSRRVCKCRLTQISFQIPVPGDRHLGMSIFLSPICKMRLQDPLPDFNLEEGVDPPFQTQIRFSDVSRSLSPPLRTATFLSWSLLLSTPPSPRPFHHPFPLGPLDDKRDTDVLDYNDGRLNLWLSHHSPLWYFLSVCSLRG